jgi:hypothetical protein
MLVPHMRGGSPVILRIKAVRSRQSFRVRSFGIAATNAAGEACVGFVFASAIE